MHPLLSCIKQINVSSWLPLFNGGQPYVEHIDSHVKENNQCLQVPNQPMDEHVDDAIDADRSTTKEKYAKVAGANFV